MNTPRFLVMAGLACLAFGSGGTKAADDAPELRLLRAENNMLKATLEQRNKEVAALKADNAKVLEQVKRLEELCRKAGITLPQSATSPAETPQAETFTYLGKPRSREWFDSMYAKFADRIAFVDGNYYDVGKEVVCRNLCREVPEAAGEIGRLYSIRGYYEKLEIAKPCGKIEQVIDSHQVVVERDGRPGTMGWHAIRIHVRGVNTKGMVDGADFEGEKLVCVGTYRRGSSTIPSYTPLVPLTKEQFAEALAKGFKLVEYKTIKVQVPGAVRILGPGKGEAPVYKDKAVPRPVP